MNQVLLNHYRCPEAFVDYRMPFDLSTVVDNFRYERYATAPGFMPGKNFTRQLYYLIRPLLPVAIRKHLQKIYLNGWEKIPFPRWPVDCSVEEVFERAMRFLLETAHVDKIPFIWFWPDGRRAGAMMTHDVETAAGRDFCSRLMDINDAFGIKSSFQVVPEKRYDVPASYLQEIRARGFEINVHGLNHHGNLFHEHKEFLRQAQRINRYAQTFGAKGFRSPVMYRNLDWYRALEFSYDMSVPNVAHLDPQRGGCCTVRPYFIGDILELPLTTIQDYSLFNIINTYSIDLWKTQIDLILQKSGLMSFLVHPDYIVAPKARAVYQALLEYLTKIAHAQNIWMALPGQVDAWWRQRRQMKLIKHADQWRIAGEGSDRARVAYAKWQDHKIVYELEKMTKYENSFS